MFVMRIVEVNKSFLRKISSLLPFNQGWGDRLRGMMSLFMISLMLDRNFRVEITHPCNLTHILRPNLYNWTQSIAGLIVTDPRTHRRRFNLTRKMLITTANAKEEILRNVSEILYTNRTIDSIWSEDVLYWATNKDYFHQLAENKFYRKKFKSYGILTKYNIKLEILFPLFYEILFQPVQTIQEHIQQVKFKQKHQHVICTQIRTGFIRILLVHFIPLDHFRSKSDYS